MGQSLRVRLHSRTITQKTHWRTRQRIGLNPFASTVLKKPR